ncbi:hypothetical protein GCM10022239_07480 [Leifsonia bigeumensis]|uniref:Uncharacterized protein n=1 Tax=Leifsonella bigeumensis TaxID=433643 RepID=A0ABP7F8W9_9MICO
MTRVTVGPVNVSRLPMESNIPGRPGVTRQVLSHNALTGATTLIQVMPAGYRPPNGEPQGSRKFEMHTCHEELFALEGTFHFGSWHTLSALGYLNHPPYWVHPADQTAATPVTFLIKFSGALDFAFEDIPSGWDGREYVHPSAPPESTLRGCSPVSVDELEWVYATDPGGAPLGFEIKEVWPGEVGGWSTSLNRYPAGWRGSGEPQRLDGGDEWFVLSGSLHLGDGVTLTAGDYYCDAEQTIDGGASAYSDDGCLAIRWRERPDHH